jgi:hypothetical protein
MGDGGPGAIEVSSQPYQKHTLLVNASIYLDSI